jgi:hypothetical protein
MYTQTQMTLKKVNYAAMERSTAMQRFSFRSQFDGSNNWTSEIKNIKFGTKADYEYTYKFVYKHCNKVTSVINSS